MVAAAYDQCDAAGNAHACDGSSVGHIHGNPQVFRRNKGNGIFHRAGRDAAFPGKDGPIVYKGSQGTLRKFPADIFLVFGKLDRFFQTVGIKVPVKERFMHADREKIEEDFSSSGELMVLPLAGKPIKNRAEMPFSVISQAVRARTSCPQ